MYLNISSSILFPHCLRRVNMFAKTIGSLDSILPVFVVLGTCDYNRSIVVITFCRFLVVRHDPETMLDVRALDDCIKAARMPEVIDITLSSSPPSSLSARIQRPLQPSSSNQPSAPSILEVGLPNSDINIDQISDGEIHTSMSYAVGGKLRPRLSRHSSATRPRNSASASSFRSSAQFDDSFFDMFENPDFQVEQPAKKRRLSPPVRKSAASNAPASVNEIFDLSSEPDAAPLPIAPCLSTETNVTVHDLEDEGAIVFDLPSFSSSAPEARKMSKAVAPLRKDDIFIDLVSDDEPLADDPIINSSQPVKTTKASAWSARTRGVLATIKQKSDRPLTHPRLGATINTSMMKQSKSGHFAKSKLDDFDNIIDSSQPAAVSKSPERRPNAIKKTKAPTKPRKTATEKEAEQEEKRQAKERQAAEKQLATDRAEVNKKRTDRKKSAEEMLLYMPSELQGKPLGNQVEAYIKEVNITVNFYEDEADMTLDDPEMKSLGKIIKWKRKVNSTYDEIKEEWVPLECKKTQPEKHILVYLTGEEFCTIAAVGPNGVSSDIAGGQPAEEVMKENLDTYIVGLSSRHPDCSVILLVEGLASFIKRIANAKNREFQASVRDQQVDLDDPTAPLSSIQPTSSGRAPKKRKRNKPTVDLSFFNNDISEILQLHLQLTRRGLQIHHTTSVVTSAKQIDSFTQHLSTRPYRQTELERNLAHASFCMASGQFRTGQGDATETFIKMLEQVNRLTVSMAHGIIDAGYDSPAKLVKCFKQAEAGVTGGVRSLGCDISFEREGKEKAKLMLEDVKKAANKDGAWNNQRLGPQISKRLWKVFMSKDEDMRDGIA